MLLHMHDPRPWRPALRDVVLVAFVTALIMTKFMPCVRTFVCRSLGLKMHNPFGSGRGKNKKKGEESAAAQDTSEH